MAKLFKQQGEELSEEEVKNVMTAMDTDGDGEVDLAEFTAFMQTSGELPARLAAITVRKQLATAEKVYMAENKRVAVSIGTSQMLTEPAEMAAQVRC